MELSYGKGALSGEAGVRCEWLVTNGLGGFASSTISGLNTRRYHGLLVAALRPPVDRRLLVAKLDEDLYIDGSRYVLGSNLVRGGYAQEGYRHLDRFQRYPFPTSTYRVGSVYIIKTVFMVHGSNTTGISYRLVNEAGRRISLYLFPLLNCRDYHHTTRENDWPFRQVVSADRKGVEVVPYDHAPRIYMASDLAEYTSEPSWYRGMYYPVEAERGLPCYEDHHIPGYFHISTAGPLEFGICFSTRPLSAVDCRAMLERETGRLQALVDKAGISDDFTRQLVLAADDFIVYRQSTGRKTVIAGYPWFGDWGRDAMISLPGLTLCTRRFEDARDILLSFARYLRNGLIPNMFPDAGQEPLYNTVDAALWFVYAVQKYLAYTGDRSFVREQLWDSLSEIVSCYREGTDYGIGMDDDGLIEAVCPGQQLTWMDARVGDWVVTPREGKPVEINALWYNALEFMSRLAGSLGLVDDCGSLAQRVRQSFQKAFWYAEGGYLYDVVRGDFRDSRLRPNQIFAVSLPHTPLRPEQARSVVYRVWEKLYTPFGLRSLDAEDPEFRGCYLGDQWQRDAAYHQGTVWSWLIGHFVTAYRKVNGCSPASRETARMFLEPFKDHLRDQGVGSIAEIFDGLPPFTARGCFAQAWGVAEVLRAWLEETGSENLPEQAGIWAAGV